MDFGTMEKGHRERLYIHLRNYVTFRRAEQLSKIYLLRALDAYLDGANTLKQIDAAETGKTKPWPGEVQGNP